jgi:hypothetical protein
MVLFCCPRRRKPQEKNGFAGIGLGGIKADRLSHLAANLNVHGMAGTIPKVYQSAAQTATSRLKYAFSPVNSLYGRITARLLEKVY